MLETVGFTILLTILPTVHCLLYYSMYLYLPLFSILQPSSSVIFIYLVKIRSAHVLFIYYSHEQTLLKQYLYNYSHNNSFYFKLIEMKINNQFVDFIHDN